MSRALRIPCALGLLAVLVSVVTVVVAPAAEGGSCYRWHPRDRRIATKTNTARASRGISKLNADPQLSYIARRHTRSMLKRRALVHSDMSRMQRIVTRERSLGENVGYGGGINQVHRAFMRSSGHRANLLKRSYRHFGISAIRRNGRVWITVIFETRRNPGTTLRRARC